MCFVSETECQCILKPFKPASGKWSRLISKTGYYLGIAQMYGGDLALVQMAENETMSVLKIGFFRLGWVTVTTVVFSSRSWD